MALGLSGKPCTRRQQAENVSLGGGIDATTLEMHLLGAIAQFERVRIVEQVRASLARAKAQGKRLGRPRAVRLQVPLPSGLTVRGAAEQWGVLKSTAVRRITAGLVSVGQTPRESC